MRRVFKRSNASLPPICMAEVAPPLRLSPRAAPVSLRHSTSSRKSPIMSGRCENASRARPNPCTHPSEDQSNIHAVLART